MDRWEYKVYDLQDSYHTKEDILNDLGKEGWELVTIVKSEYSKETTAYLMRVTKESE